MVWKVVLLLLVGTVASLPATGESVWRGDMDDAKLMFTSLTVTAKTAVEILDSLHSTLNTCFGVTEHRLKYLYSRPHYENQRDKNSVAFSDICGTVDKASKNCTCFKSNEYIDQNITDNQRGLPQVYDPMYLIHPNLTFQNLNKY